MEDPGDQANAVPVVKRHQDVRAPHLQRLDLPPAHDRQQRSALLRRQDVSGHATACVLF